MFRPDRLLDSRCGRPPPWELANPFARSGEPRDVHPSRPDQRPQEPRPGGRFLPVLPGVPAVPGPPGRERPSLLLPTARRAVDIGHSKVCESCGLLTPAPPDGYRAISNDPDADLDDADRRDEPGHPPELGLPADPRGADRREEAHTRRATTLLREPFDMAAEVLARRSIEGKLDLPSDLGCLATFLLPVVCLPSCRWPGRPRATRSRLVAVVVGGVLRWPSPSSPSSPTPAATPARRRSCQAVDSLRPLDPSAEEIDQILESSVRPDRRSRSRPAPRPHNGLLERWE